MHWTLFESGCLPTGAGTAHPPTGVDIAPFERTTGGGCKLLEFSDRYVVGGHRELVVDSLPRAPGAPTVVRRRSFPRPRLGSALGRRVIGRQVGQSRITVPAAGGLSAIFSPGAVGVCFAATFACIGGCVFSRDWRYGGSTAATITIAAKIAAAVLHGSFFLIGRLFDGD